MRHSSSKSALPSWRGPGAPIKPFQTEVGFVMHLEKRIQKLEQQVDPQALIDAVQFWQKNGALPEGLPARVHALAKCITDLVRAADEQMGLPEPP